MRFTGGDPADRSWEALEELSFMASSGKLDLPIRRSYQLTDAAAAHTELESGHSSGKVILTV